MCVDEKRRQLFCSARTGAAAAKRADWGARAGQAQNRRGTMHSQPSGDAPTLALGVSPRPPMSPAQRSDTMSP